MSKLWPTTDDVCFKGQCVFHISQWPLHVWININKQVPSAVNGSHDFNLTKTEKSMYAPHYNVRVLKRKLDTLVSSIRGLIINLDS